MGIQNFAKYKILESGHTAQERFKSNCYLDKNRLELSLLHILKLMIEIRLS